MSWPAQWSSSSAHLRNCCFSGHRVRVMFCMGAGDQQTSGVHIDDLARLYVLALKKAPAGTVFNATSSNDNSARCALVARCSGLPMRWLLCLPDRRTSAHSSTLHVAELHPSQGCSICVMLHTSFGIEC